MKAAVAFLFVLCCLAASHAAWTCRDAPRLYNPQQIDAGLGHTVAVDRYRRVYFLSGSSWYSLASTSLKYVSTGPAGTWGCDYSNKVYRLVAGNFKPVTGLTMLKVDAGGEGDIMGIHTSYNNTYCVPKIYASQFSGSRSLSLTYMSIRLMHVSCGGNICWGVSNTYRVYVAMMYPSTTSCRRRTSWYTVTGLSLKMIEVSTDGSVFGVATNGMVYQRYGITSSNFRGTAWRNIPMCMPMKHLTYDLKNLWVLTASNMLLVCTP